MDVDTARQLAELCEREASLARTGGLAELEALAERLGALYAVLPRERHTDPRVRAELARALTATRLTGAVLQERLVEVTQELRGVGERATVARAYAATVTR
jgi:hypothetical protein